MPGPWEAALPDWAEPLIGARAIANPSFKAATVTATTTTTQIAPTIITALGLNPSALDAVRAEGTAVLSEVEAQLAQ